MAPEPRPAPAPQEDSVDRYRQGATTVAKDTSFNGTLKTEGNLYIEGNFDGELEAQETIFIAEGARVKAQLRATDVIVAGTLDGTVDAGDRFHAMPTSRVTGEINSRVLVVEQGSHVNCQFAMKQRGR
jgi:cytoskeletal protein CcmA (bactofilin family)